MKAFFGAILGVVLILAANTSGADDPPAAQAARTEAPPEQTTEPEPAMNSDARPAERFVPSEEISEDLSVSFPSDI